ncbi:MAG: ModE family transcriptional regulator [Cyclobacteriaceae bacterium]
MEKILRIRCWITLDGDKYFGPGRVQLLGLIQSEGSLSKAAQKMGMSYKKAWDMVNDLNSRGSQPYVILKKGGEKGGGAEITSHAKNLIFKFSELSEELDKITAEKADILDMI